MRGDSWTEEIPLAGVDPKTGHVTQLSRRLRTLGDRTDLHRPKQAHDGEHHRALFLLVKADHKGTVDLHDIDGQLVQVIDGRVSSAKVVQSDLYASRAQLVQRHACALQVLQQGCLGDFQHQL